ncbi:hypothetical protein [Janthinobacterium lividum]|nr:hypothetical protein [Janthinobacterium lividum]
MKQVDRGGILAIDEAKLKGVFKDRFLPNGDRRFQLIGEKHVSDA